jgi:hypothetical protein
MWRPNHSNDYRFFDRIINEQFTVGGTGINVHLYLGPATQTDSTDSTVPEYANPTAKKIEDLLFLENRDRTYREDIFNLRGIYQIADNDFDLSQFGIQLANDTIFIVFHLNTMVEYLGRRLMVGDVLELEHLKDYYPLDMDAVPEALRKYYVIKDVSRGAEGFSQTWWPHLWRVKCEPMVDSQEYKDIINNGPGISAIYDTFIGINDAIIAQSEKDVPKSGYDVNAIYNIPRTVKGDPGVPKTPTADKTALTIDHDLLSTSGSSVITADSEALSPDSQVTGYLTGDGLTPNGMPIVQGIEFPGNPLIGDYCLRVDYTPNRLFRWDGRAWRKIEDAVRTTYTPGTTNQTLKSGFFNNAKLVTTNDGKIVNSRQGLSKALRPPEDY